MNREQLAHVVRAAATVVGVDDVIVLGSQAILATVDDVELPYEVTRSIEADIAVDHEISRISLGVDRPCDGPIVQLIAPPQTTLDGRSGCASHRSNVQGRCRTPGSSELERRKLHPVIRP